MDYKIKSTNQYGLFVISKNNRKVDEKHVDKLAKEFEKNGYITAFPIVAVIEKGKYKIIDGQHRFLAAKKVGCYFSFVEIDVVDESDWLEKIQNINKLSKQWTAIDYLGLSDSKNIKEILKIIDENPKYSSFILAYCNLSKSTAKRENIKETDTTELKEAIWVISSLSKYALIQKQAVMTVRFFIKNKLSIDRLLKNIEKQPMKFVNCATAQQFREMIEYFYNYDHPKKNRIKFDIE